jgi:putative FmdB family regulatory protein
MPMYEFACRECEHAFAELVFGDEKVACPKCTSRKVERLISVPGRPQSGTSAELPTACNSVGPPCGPQCRRL